MHTKIIITAATLFLFSSAFASKSEENKLYKKIYNIYKTQNIKNLNKKSNYFYKKYPKSRYIPDIKVYNIDLEKDYKTSLENYKKIIKNYRYYKKKGKVYLKICNILYLKAKWKELYKYSNKGIKFARTDFEKNSFSRYKIISLMKIEKFEKAKNHAEKSLYQNHSYSIMSKNLLLLSYLNRKDTGYSREYIYKLREMLIGFQNSEITPANLLLLGDFYEKKKIYNKSYTAYTDLIIRYPKSPESLYAKKAIKRIQPHNPKKEEYIPGKKILTNTSVLDINPEIDLSEKNKSTVTYAVLIGPLNSRLRAQKLKRIISQTGVVKIVYVKNRYNLYTGFKYSSDSILKYKIRLAEEYGLNGRIVRIHNFDKKKYIYGE